MARQSSIAEGADAGRGKSEQNRRLVGWKAIAANLGKDERTAKRWASQSGMPVHRVPGRQRGSVYAYAEEIEIWLRREQKIPDISVVVAASPPGRPPRYRLYGDVLAMGALFIGLGIGAGLTAWDRVGPAPLRSSPAAPALPQELARMQHDAAYLWQKRDPQSLQQAEALLLRLAVLAPHHAGTQSDLATVYDLMVEYRILPAAEGYAKAAAAAEAALALNPDDAQALTVLGDIAVFWQRDYEAGMRHFERALDSDGQHGLARHWYASALMSTGRFNEAAVQIERARQIEPTSRSIQVSAAMIALGSAQPERARQELLGLIGNEPGYRSPYRFLAFAELALGHEDDYLAAWQERFRLTDDPIGAAVVEAGHKARAHGASYIEAMLAAAHDRATDIEPYFLAHLLALSGDWQRAAAQLGKTPTRHAFYYSIDPAFHEARATPQFMAAIAELGLPVVP